MTSMESGSGREHVVVVPGLTGLDVPAAHDAALDGGLLAVEQRTCQGTVELRVLRQEPAAGTVAPYGSEVTVWTGPVPPGDDGGGGGGGGVKPVGPGPVLSSRG